MPDVASVYLVIFADLTYIKRLIRVGLICLDNLDVSPMLLSESEIKEKLANRSGWSLEGKQIWKRYECRDFTSAISFVNELAKEAEAMDHHPDILISNWNRVTIHITTHSAGGLTDPDFKLATRIDSRFALIA